MFKIGDYVRCSEPRFRYDWSLYYIKSIDGETAVIVCGAKYSHGAYTRIEKSKVYHSVPLSSLTLDRGERVVTQIRQLEQIYNEICFGRKLGGKK